MFVFVILSIWLSLCFGESSIANRSNYLLPGNVNPIHYTITMAPDLSNATFIGTVAIKIAVEKPTNEIILHQVDLNITIDNIRLTLIDNLDDLIGIKDAGKFGTIDQEFYKISLEKTLPVDGYILTISNFKGSLEQNFVGFYTDNYPDENNTILYPYAVTNFQPTYARYAFPCFDEPALKAMFKINIIRPRNYFSVSNNELISTKIIDDDLEVDEFEEGERMSTYSVSFLISQLEQSRRIGVNTAVGRPEYITKGAEHYFLHVADRILLCFEKLFKTKYMLNKLQHVALPSFYNPDMEAWGFIPHNEQVVLELNNTLTNAKQQVTITLAHKICHQWFGDLVTVEWWSYVWLNEGFCEYVSYVVIDELYPEWDVKQILLAHAVNNVMRYDYLKSIQPLNQDVETPQQISNIFGLISYSKGAAVIQMLEAIVGPKTFSQGLANYINNYGFDTVVPADLYDTLQECLNNKTMKSMEKLKIFDIMSTWDNQSGFPLVNVKRNYDNSDNMRNVVFTQQIFSYTPDVFSESIWTIPINYATKSKPSFKKTVPTHWLQNRTEILKIEELTKTDWLIINKKQAYYYRVNYDRNNWMLIINALRNNHESIDELNRIQLIYDSFAAASMGLTDLAIPFRITAALKRESKYGAMRALRNTLDNLERRVSGTVAELLLQAFIENVISNIYNRYTKRQLRVQKHQDKLISELIFSWLSELNYEKCTSDALTMYKNWRRGFSIPEHLEKHVLCSVVKNSNEKRWEFLFIKYYNETDRPTLKRNLFYALGCSTDGRLLNRLLDFTEKSEYYNIVDVLFSIMARGPTGLEIALQYIVLNFEALFVSLGKNNMNDILIGIGSRITEQKQLNQLRQLSNRFKSESKLFDLATEKAEENIEWNKNYLKKLVEYLENYQRGTTVCCLPFDSLLLICVTLLLLKF